MFKHVSSLVADRPDMIDTSDDEDDGRGHVDGQDRRSDDNTSYVDPPSESDK